MKLTAAEMARIRSTEPLVRAVVPPVLQQLGIEVGDGCVHAVLPSDAPVPSVRWHGWRNRLYAAVIVTGTPTLQEPRACVRCRGPVKSQFLGVTTDAGVLICLSVCDVHYADMKALAEEYLK